MPRNVYLWILLLVVLAATGSLVLGSRRPAKDDSCACDIGLRRVVGFYQSLCNWGEPVSAAQSHTSICIDGVPRSVCIVDLYDSFGNYLAGFTLDPLTHEIIRATCNVPCYSMPIEDEYSPIGLAWVAYQHGCVLGVFQPELDWKLVDMKDFSTTGGKIVFTWMAGTNVARIAVDTHEGRFLRMDVRKLASNDEYQPQLSYYP